MALCVVQGAGGQLVFQDPQPANTTTCPYVLLSGSEAGMSPFNLTSQDATLIGVAIWTLWASAWGIRQVCRMLVSGDGSGESS